MRRIQNEKQRTDFSAFDLIRKFKNHIGVTPYEYLIKWRINKSKSLLENATLSVSEIAGRVGFNDASYFIKVFREHENTTPLSYRKHWAAHSSGSE